MRTLEQIGKDRRTHAIIGAAMEVHRQLGCGFLEPVYQEALALEFDLRRLPYRREVELPVFYKGSRLNATYKPDFICYDSLVVELKALALLSGVEEAQILNYMKAGKFEHGLLLNFGARALEYRRFILTASAGYSLIPSEPSVQSAESADVLSAPSEASVESAKSADVPSAPSEASVESAKSADVRSAPSEASVESAKSADVPSAPSEASVKSAKSADVRSVPARDEH